MRVERLTRLDDPRLDAWLDLYQAAFPLNEQLPASDLIRTLRDGSETTHLLVAEEDGDFAGLIHYEFFELTDGGRVLALWYLATRPEARGSGLGARVYKEHVMRTVIDTGCVALVFEVEKPEVAMDAELARRRIGFYQRNGAKLVTGASVISTGVGGDPTELLVMIHPVKPIDDLASMLAQVLPSGLRVTGELGLK